MDSIIENFKSLIYDLCLLAAVLQPSQLLSVYMYVKEIPYMHVLSLKDWIGSSKGPKPVVMRGSEGYSPEDQHF